jgi:integrase
LVALVAGTGLRIGEALAVRTEDFYPDCQVLHVRRSVWHRCEQAPKTPNAIRLVDIPEALAQVLRRYTEGKDGYLFATRAGRLLDQRNSLKALHGAGNRGGFHASTPRNYGSTWHIVANGVIELVWDLSWANWVIKVWHQFARYSSRKPVLRQVLKLVEGGQI